MHWLILIVLALRVFSQQPEYKKIAGVTPTLTAFKWGFATHVADKFGKEAFELLHQLTPSQYWNHPEFGYLPFNTPCDSCIELIHLRTARQRVYVSLKSPHTRKFLQASAGFLHWKDANGWWRTLNPYLLPSSNTKSLFYTQFPEMQVVIDTSLSTLILRSSIYQMQLVRTPRLYLINDQGQRCREVNTIAKRHNIGSSGWLTIHLWPDINREVLIKGYGSQVWLRYIFLRKPQWFNCQNVKEIIIEDTLVITDLVPSMPSTQPFHDTVIFFSTNSPTLKLTLSPAYLIGNLTKRQIAKVAYEMERIDKERILWKIHIPVAFLDSFSYPIVLDPLMSVTGTYTAACGFDHVMPQPISLPATCTDPNYCECTLTLTGLGGTQLTNAIYSFNTQDNGGVNIENCSYGSNPLYLHYNSVSHGFTWVVGPCGCEASPWWCSIDCDNPPCNWSCTGTNCPIHYYGSCNLTNNPNPTLVTCLPPQCNDYTLNFNLRNWHRQLCTSICLDIICLHYCGCIFGNGCDSYAAGVCRTDELYIVANSWTVTVEGRTVEGLATANGSSGNVTVTCADLPITLCSNPQYGVPAYTTVWQDNLGNTIGTGDCISGINPPSNTTVTYTAIITDACGNTYTTSVTVNNTCVLPIQSLELKLKNRYPNAYLLWNVVGSDIDYYEVLAGKQPETLHPVGKVTHRSNQNQYEWQIPLTLQKESEIYFQIKAYLNDGTTFKSNILRYSYEASTYMPQIKLGNGYYTLILQKPVKDTPLILYSIEGKRLWSAHPTTPQTTFTLPHLASGIYLVKIGDAYFRVFAP